MALQGQQRSLDTFHLSFSHEHNNPCPIYTLPTPLYTTNNSPHSSYLPLFISLSPMHWTYKPCNYSVWEPRHTQPNSVHDAFNNERRISKKTASSQWTVYHTNRYHLKIDTTWGFVDFDLSLPVQTGKTSK